MSADYINIQNEKDKLAEDNAKLVDQMKKIRHRKVSILVLQSQLSC